ncbi:site-specific integrase [Siccirubricoccus phaeus]|uniref:site-specific integrase n=1 Tax=Siccirubricoccus phaeus TaxID=2595053 RepID=UPI001A9C5901|nr:site-specific integrase [Siccirubricoccus phaeus]
MARTKLQTPNFTLSKRADGYYVIRYTDPATGKTRDKATGTKDAKEAEEERARFAADYRKPKLAKNPTVAELCDAYLEYRKPQVKSAASLEHSYSPIKRHIGALYAQSITQTTITDYIKKRSGDVSGGASGRLRIKPVSEATINKELRQLRAALNWAGSEDKIDRVPTFRIELSAGEARDRWITKEEANRLMETSSPHIALFLLIALSTAKRREAILTLTWGNVALHPAGHETIDFGDDVGNKRRGKTPIAGNVRLIEALKAAKGVAKTPYVIEFRGKQVADVKTALRASCRRAGVEEITSHVLKHSAITWMVQAGIPYEQIGKFTNTSKDIIEKVYGHHSPAFVAEAVGALAF